MGSKGLGRLLESCDIPGPDVPSIFVNGEHVIVLTSQRGI
jgi:hypothetical protein